MSRLSDIPDIFICVFKTEAGELIMDQDDIFEEMENEVSKTFSARQATVFQSRKNSLN